MSFVEALIRWYSSRLRASSVVRSSSSWRGGVTSNSSCTIGAGLVHHAPALVKAAQYLFAEKRARTGD